MYILGAHCCIGNAANLNKNPIIIKIKENTIRLVISFWHPRIITISTISTLPNIFQRFDIPNKIKAPEIKPPEVKYLIPASKALVVLFKKSNI